MRLDKFLSTNLGISRNEAKKLIANGEISHNDEIIKDASLKITATQKIYYQNQEIIHIKQGQYFALHKPEGYICSTTEDLYPSVFSLFPYPLSTRLHCVGRLDVDTSGLIFLTDDGVWSHKITSPKYLCPKTYLVTLAEPVQEHYIEACTNGILLHGEKKPTKAAELKIVNETQVNLTIYEGKYHQVKRMFAALDNKVIGLHRWRVGSIILNSDLLEAEYYQLSAAEIASFK